MTQPQAVDWLYAHAGPIIRCRMVHDWGYPAAEAPMFHMEQVLALPETQRWLANLGGPQIHGSRDTAAENAAAKLLAYGLGAGIPALDAKMLPYADKVNTGPWDMHSDTIAPFLIATGYAHHPKVTAWFCARLEQLGATARHGEYDIYISPQTEQAPKYCRGKWIYKECYYNGPMRLPSIYDLVALCYWPAFDSVQNQAIEQVIAYISDPRFQSTPGGYLWRRKRSTLYAAGRCWLACMEPVRKVLFLDLTARFAVCRNQPWFQETLAELEAYAPQQGDFIFPAGYLAEKRDSHYLYNSAHMGLGEDRRQPGWREVESTFWMLQIRHRMGNQVSKSGAICSVK